MKKICFFGGTFNPVHFGHINVVRKIKEALECDKIIVVPNGKPPHKKNDTSPEDRYNMVKLAFEDIDYVDISNFELKKKTVSYTWETLEHFKKSNSDSDFYFIMGMDNLYDIKTWKCPEKICKLAHLVFLKRKGFEPDEKEFSYLKEKCNAKIHTVDFDFPCSSTDIRKAIKNGEYIFDDVDIRVFYYILKHGLYETENVSEYDYYENEVKKLVDEKRFLHSIGVACCSYLLAVRYNENPKEAYFAGLVHDIAKKISYEKQLLYCKSIKLSKDETEYKKMLHAPAGAGMLKEKYKIKDKKILNGVRFHTKGDPKMTLFDKIIYMADYIEQYRNYNGVENLRKTVFENIDKGILEASDGTIKMLIEKKGKISPCIIELRNKMLENFFVERNEK